MNSARLQVSPGAGLLASVLTALGRGLARGLAGSSELRREAVAARWRAHELPKAPPVVTVEFPGVRFARATVNRKLAPVRHVEGTALIPLRPVAAGPYCCATSVSIEATCQDSCPFKHNGCFADAGFTRIQSKKMDTEARRSSGVDVARREAALIDDTWPGGVPQDGARGGRDLRLHVGGDAADAASAKLLAGAAERWRARGGGAVWTFTHAWRSIPRAAWGKSIAVLASVESAKEARKARRAGYAAALVVADFPGGDAAWDIGGGLKAIPCPAETRGTTCVECRLCLDRDLLGLNRAIAFRVHGRQADKALAALAEAA